jgi:hypothetical protein
MYRRKSLKISKEIYNMKWKTINSQNMNEYYLETMPNLTEVRLGFFFIFYYILFEDPLSSHNIPYRLTPDYI